MINESVMILVTSHTSAAINPAQNIQICTKFFLCRKKMLFFVHILKSESNKVSIKLVTMTLSTTDSFV